MNFGCDGVESSGEREHRSSKGLEGQTKKKGVWGLCCGLRILENQSMSLKEKSFGYSCVGRLDIW